MKPCFKCGAVKPLGEFYAHPQMPDGHVNKCKDCNRADVRANRASKAEYYRAYDRVRFYEAGARGKPTAEAEKRSSEAWGVRNREKRRAHSRVSHAITAGRLTRPTCCSACGEDRKLQAHHDDYSKPLDVRWLCTTCHAAHHRKYDEAEDRRFLEETRARRTGSHG